MSGKLQPYAKSCLTELSKLHSKFTWDYSEGIHFSDQMFFRFIFEDWSKIISRLSKRFSAGLLKLQSMCQKEIFWWDFDCNENLSFFISGHWAERYRPSAKICAGKLSELHSKFPKEYFEVNIFIEVCVFQPFSIFDLKKIKLFPIFLLQVLHNCILLVQRNLFEK